MDFDKEIVQNEPNNETEEQALIDEPADERIFEPEEKPIRKRKGIGFVKSVLCNLGLLLTGALIALLLVPNALSMYLSNDSAYSKLSALQSVVRNFYVDADEVDEALLNDMMATGYIYGLGDPYAAYLNEETYSSILYSNEGGTSGVGVTVVFDPDASAIYVVRVSEESPAAQAGLQHNDRILAVGGVAVTQENYNDSVNNIRGETGTDVTLTVLRDGETFDVAVTRGDFTATSVYSRMIGSVCLIEITDFNTATTEQFKAALDEAIASGATGLIFDLRGNTGGLVDVTSDMLDMLLPKGEIGYAVYNGGKRVSLAKSDAKEIDLPMAVLTDGDTASASEYFALALRDYEKAALIGEKTFGKGIMQSTMPLGDGSAVRVTVAKFYTKSGTEFHGVGLLPDKEVKIDQSTASRFLLADSDEPVIQAAIEYLNGQK